MLNCLVKCWGIAPQPDPATADAAVSDVVRIRLGRRASPASPTAPRTNDSPQQRASIAEGPGRGSGGYLLPEELRRRPSSTAPSRRNSACNPSPALFTRVRDVDYHLLDEVMRNHQAMAQLHAVSERQFCSENLDFLVALNELHDDPSAASKWARFETIIAAWVSPSAQCQINIDAPTQAGLSAAFDAGRNVAAIGTGSEIDTLLSEAEAKIKRLVQNGPLKTLRDGLIAASVP